MRFSSLTHLCLTLSNPIPCSMPGFPVHHQLPELAQTHVHRVSDANQPSHPLSFPSPPAPNPSQHQNLFNESTLHVRWPQYWSFSFSIIVSKEHPGLISLRMDWLDLLAVQGTLNSLLQHNSSKVSILCNPMDCSMPGFPNHHQLPELTQTHVHRVSDANQPSHHLLSTSPPAFNLFQHQGLFK